jgi:hypothetical protein
MFSESIGKPRQNMQPTGITSHLQIELIAW